MNAKKQQQLKTLKMILSKTTPKAEKTALKVYYSATLNAFVTIPE